MTCRVFNLWSSGQTFLRISHKTEEATNFSFNEFNELPWLNRNFPLIIKKQLVPSISAHLAERNASGVIVDWSHSRSRKKLYPPVQNNGIRLFQLTGVPRSWLRNHVDSNERIVREFLGQIGIEQESSRAGSLGEWVHLDFLGV